MTGLERIQTKSKGSTSWCFWGCFRKSEYLTAIQYQLAYLETLEKHPFYFWADEATDFSALLPGCPGPVTPEFLGDARLVERSHIVASSPLRVPPITFFKQNLTTPILRTSRSIPYSLPTPTPTPINSVADVDCLTKHDEEVFINHCQADTGARVSVAYGDFQVNK